MSNIEPADTSSTHKDALSYYSTVQEQGLERRNESPIYHSRNFNNWIKGILIRMYKRLFQFDWVARRCISAISEEYMQRIRTEYPDRAKELYVFDMGCGKGISSIHFEVRIMCKIISRRWYSKMDQIQCQISHLCRFVVAKREERWCR